MVGLTPLFCGKVPDFAYIIQPTKKECFSPKYHRFHALDFWLESPPWVDFPMPSRSQENEVPQSSAPAEVHTTTASSGSEDAAPGVTTPIVIKHGWEFHGDLWSKWSFFFNSWENHEGNFRQVWLPEGKGEEDLGNHRFTGQIFGFNVNWLSFIRNIWYYILWVYMSHRFNANSGISRLCWLKTIPIWEEQGEAHEKKEELRMQKEEQEKRHQLLRPSWPNPVFLLIPATSMLLSCALAGCIPHSVWQDLRPEISG